MMWHYFPIGFRFPVGDFSEETKRHCWKITLSALLKAGGEGATLFETEQAYDYGSDSPVYLCIACFENIKQSRAVAKKLYAQDALMMELTLHKPFLQANALEAFGPYVQHGTLMADGTVARTETAFPCFPESVQTAEPTKGLRLLLAAEPTGDAYAAETVTRTLGALACEQGFRVRRMLLADGGKGTVRALVTAKNGRYEPVVFRDAQGTQETEIIGILPGAKVVMDPSRNRAEVLRIAQTYGYCHFWIGERTENADAQQMLKMNSDPCMIETFGKDDILGLIGLADAAARSDAVCLFLSGGLQEDTVLARLAQANKPTLLLTACTSPDPQRLKKMYPYLVDIITCPKLTEMPLTAIKKVFHPQMLIMSRKDVVKDRKI